jgi:hypothetical protein
MEPLEQLLPQLAEAGGGDRRGRSDDGVPFVLACNWIIVNEEKLLFFETREAQVAQGLNASHNRTP